LPPKSVPEERLQKWLASAGLGSRREIEGWIAAGRVTINGQPAVLGQKVTGTERIAIDGRQVRRMSRRHRTQPRVLIYHKPVGEICSRSDPQGRQTVFRSLPAVAGGRWIVVGRLDIDTSGLLLFTTDGALANALMHPSTALIREYAVRVRGTAEESALRELRAGIELDDGPGRFADITFEGGEGTNQWYRVSVAEGRNRIVRRLWEAVGHQVSRLIRVRFGPVELPRRLPRGRYREMKGRELDALYEAAGLTRPEGGAARRTTGSRSSCP
jgi:23S rRNA pseudouridine2605 synthase